MMMFVQQISVFVENKKGRLADITKVLAENNIDISAISIADTANFGVLRMIVNETEKAVQVIREAGYTVSITEVLAVEMEDKPGGLHKVLELLGKESISVEYLYSFVRCPSEKALILFKVDNPQKTVDVLRRGHFRVLSFDEVKAL